MSEFIALGDTPSHPPRISGDRAVVEQAKGALMLRYRVNSNEAFALLLAWARHSNTTLHTIAHALVKDVLQSGEANQGESALARWLRDQLNTDISAHRQRAHP